jgi:uncharacterized protein (DUF1697 family)
MASYAAFLRGMNVGPHHRVTNDELKRMFMAIGFSEVATFRASGNVVFTTEEPPDAVAPRIGAELERSLGYAVPTLVRSAQEIRAVAAMQPFDAELVEASAGKLQVSVLPSAPSPKTRREILAQASDEDRLAFAERELYWLPSGGILESALDLDAIERAIGPSTRRTKGTIEQMAAKYFAG